MEKALALTRAEENTLTIQSLCKDIYHNFLELGGLLAENQDYDYWSQCGYESFRDFVEQLGVGSYSWATRLIGISRVVASQLLAEAEIMEIGVSKACLLLPHIKNGGLPEDIKLLARDCTFTDLRKELGHKIPMPEDSHYYVPCPRCGQDVDVLRCRCGQEFSLNKNMIRRR